MKNRVKSVLFEVINSWATSMCPTGCNAGFRWWGLGSTRGGRPHVPICNL